MPDSDSSPTRQAVSAEADLGRRLAEAAASFLDSLDPGQRSLAHLSFDHGERRRWHYTPRDRAGVSMAELGRSQAKAAHRLVAAGVRFPTYARLVSIVGLEDVLDAAEGGRADRHAGDYWVAVFGDPDDEGEWGWRFEGHHVSVNYTVTGTRVAATPLFLGANPAHVTDGSATVLRPLGREEDLALALLDAMDERQRARAVFSDAPPPDIVTGEQPGTPPELEPRGVAGADLAGDAADLLQALARTFVERLPEELARPRLAELEEHGVADLHFAWAGELAVDRRHYYRLQAPGLLAELDDTEPDGNHVHTVLRDPDDDFGEGLLAAHHRAHHQPGP